MKQKEVVPNHEALEGKITILCLCHGNVLRSQWAEFILKLMGIDAKSAALGDVSKQQYQEKIPKHITEFMNRLGLHGALTEGRIKGIDEKMFKSADRILVFCNPEYLNNFSFIDKDDPRIHPMESPDPFKDITQYQNILLEIINAVVDFVRKNMSDRLPPGLSGETHFNSIGHFLVSLNPRLLESFIKPWSHDEYFTDHGYNSDGVIRQILNWLMLLELPGYEEQSQLFPNRKESVRIIEAIEFERYKEAISILSDLREKINLRIRYAQNQSTWDKKGEKRISNNQTQNLGSLFATYNTLIRTLNRYANQD